MESLRVSYPHQELRINRMVTLIEVEPTIHSGGRFPVEHSVRALRDAGHRANAGDRRFWAERILPQVQSDQGGRLCDALELGS